MNPFLSQLKLSIANDQFKETLMRYLGKPQWYDMRQELWSTLPRVRRPAED